MRSFHNQDITGNFCAKTFLSWLLTAFYFLFQNVSLSAESVDLPKLIFYAPFDGTAEPAVAGGDKEPVFARLEYVPGKKGQAVRIKRANEIAGLSYSAPGNINIKAGTLSFWWLLDWTPAQDQLPLPGRMPFFLNLSDGSVIYLFFHGKNPDYTADPDSDIRVIRCDFMTGRKKSGDWCLGEVKGWQNGQWHMVTLTWDCAEGIKIYDNGNLVTEREKTWGPVEPKDRFYIGMDVSGNYDIEGPVDELRIYDRALTADQVIALYRGELKDEIVSNAKPLPPANKPEEKESRQEIISASFDGSSNIVVSGRTELKPGAAQNLKYVPGIAGQALNADEQTRLAYEIGELLNKEHGTLSFWFKPYWDIWEPEEHVFISTDEARPDIRINISQPYLVFGMYGHGYQNLPVVTHLEKNNWYNITVVWEKGTYRTVYLDGMRRSNHPLNIIPITSPDRIKPSKQLWIGGEPSGKNPAMAAIDELKIWDRVLSDEEVLEAAGKLKPLHLVARHTTLFPGEQIDLDLRFYNRTRNVSPVPECWQLISPEGQKAAGGVIPDGPPGVSVKSEDKTKMVPARGWLKVDVKTGVSAGPGLWRVECGNKEFSNITYRATLYVPQGKDLALGPEKVETPVIKTEVVDEMDCVVERNPDRIALSTNCHVVESPLGKYLETGPELRDRFACRLNVKEPGKLHYLSIEFPDDKARAAGVDELRKNYWFGPGYLTGGDARLTNKMLTLTIPMYPLENQVLFHVMTECNGEPAAARRVQLLKAEKPMAPALVREPESDISRRLIGECWEQFEALSYFLGKAGYFLAPSDNFLALDRYSALLASTGQNCLEMSFGWYYGVDFPSSLAGFMKGGGRGGLDENLLTLCSKRGITIIPHVLFSRVEPLMPKLHDFRGKPYDNPIAFVSWDSKVNTTFDYSFPAAFSPFHLEVQKAIRDEIDEFMALYGDEPCIPGICLSLVPFSAVWASSLLYGYEDSTVRLFEKETGIKVPETSKGVGRFSERYRFLTGGHKEEWISWRCKKLYEFYSDLVKTVKKYKKDGKLYLSGGASRECGIDPLLLNKNPDIVFLHHYARPGNTRCSLSRSQGSPSAYVSEEISLLPEGNQKLINLLENRTVYCGDSYWENDPKRKSFAELKENWCPPPLYFTHELGAPGRYYLKTWAIAMANTDPYIILSGGIIPITVGHENETLEFARSFRALPAMRFSDYPDMSDPVCLRTLVHGDQYYFYLVNREPYPIKVRLYLKGQKSLEELTTGEQIKVSGKGKAELTLDVYQLRSFRIIPGKAVIEKAEIIIPDEEKKVLKGQLDELQKALLSDPDFGQKCPRANETLTKAQQAFDSGKLSETRIRLNGSVVAELKQRMASGGNKNPKEDKRKEK